MALSLGFAGITTLFLSEWVVYLQGWVALWDIRLTRYDGQCRWGLPVGGVFRGLGGLRCGGLQSFNSVPTTAYSALPPSCPDQLSSLRAWHVDAAVPDVFQMPAL